jgi:GNAT superfamily N-acetyltransferase
VLRRLDPPTEPQETLDWMYELRRQAQVEAAPDELPESRDSYVGRLRHPVSTGRHHTWAIGGVGYATLDIDTNSPTGFVRVYVATAHRRRGAGRELAEAAIHQARADGCGAVTSLFGIPAGAALTAALGGRSGGASIRSVLALPTAASPVVPPGYALRSWSGAAPDELLQTVAEAWQAIADAPFEGGLYPEAWNPAKLRATEQAMAARGQELRMTVALAGERAVALTALCTPPAPGATAFTEDTAVVRDHRGRGLGLAVKAESLRRLAAERPHITNVSTSNHETNAAMLAINRRLGFTPVSRWTSAYLSF